jgi:hypothetical protein
MGDRMIRFVFAAALLFSITPAHAEGALAIGITNDYSQGFAAGWGTNYANAKAAEDAALKRCQDEPSAPENIRKLCKIVEGFRNRCVSIAIDPKDGETGTGWAVGATRDEAEREALARCRQTANRDRLDACRVSTGGCDGSAK